VAEFDRGAAPELVLDDAEDTTLLSRDEDPSRVGCFVAAVSFIDKSALDVAARERPGISRVMSTVTRATSSAPLPLVWITPLHRPRLNAGASPSSPSHETGEQVAPGGDHVRLGEYALGPGPVGGAEDSTQIAPNREAG
jgi:hypothetical protein